MTRKQVSFRRNVNVNVVEESPSALSVASEGTAGFLSISQTRMMLSMVDDHSVFSTSTESGDATRSDSEIAASTGMSGNVHLPVPVHVSTSASSSTSADSGVGTSSSKESDKLLQGGNESQRLSGDLRQSKKDLMRSRLEEYGPDDDFSAKGDSLSGKSTNDELDNPHDDDDDGDDGDNDYASDEHEIDSHIDSHIDSDSDNDKKELTQKFTAEKSETTCETALDDSDHDQDQESSQLQAEPLQPTTARQTPKGSAGSQTSRSPSQSSPPLSRKDSHEDNSDPDLKQMQQTYTPKTLDSKSQIRSNIHSSTHSHSTTVFDTGTSFDTDPDDDFPVRPPLPSSMRSAYETDPFSSPMSTGSSDFHLRKFDSDIDKELAEVLMDFQPPPHDANDEKSIVLESDEDHNIRSPQLTSQRKADAAELPVMEDSDQDSAISISSDEGLLDRAVRRRSIRKNFPDGSSTHFSVLRTSTASEGQPETTTGRKSSNRWKVKVRTRTGSSVGKSKTRISTKEKSTTSNQSIPVTGPPKSEQIEIDDDSSVESPLPEDYLLNDSLDEFLEQPIEENLVETMQHEALDSDSDDDSPILLIKPRIKKGQPEVELLSEPSQELVQEPLEEKPVDTKQHASLDSDGDADSPIVLIRPRIRQLQPEAALLSEPLDEVFQEPIEEKLVETKQRGVLDSNSHDDTPVVMTKPPTTGRQPALEVSELEEINLKTENETKVTPNTTEDSVISPKRLESMATRGVSKAHDPPGVHGIDTATTPTKSSSEIAAGPAESIKSQTPAKQAVKLQKTGKLAKKEFKTNPKKLPRENANKVKSTETTPAGGEETNQDANKPLRDEMVKLTEKATKTRQKAKKAITKTKPKSESEVKAKKENSRVYVKKGDPEPDKLPPYEFSYQPAHKDHDGSPHPTRSSSMKSTDSDGIWRPPKDIPGLHGSATDLNSPDKSNSSLDSDDLKLTPVEWKSFKAPTVKSKRPSVDTGHQLPRPQTPDFTSDRQRIGAKSPAAANQLSTVELNAITLSGNRSEASSSDYQGTPGGTKRVGRFMKWTRGNKNEPTRRLSNESFESGDVPSRSTLATLENEDEELEKTPRTAKSRTFLWPTIPRLPSIEKNLSEATKNTHTSKSFEDTKKLQSPRLTAKSLPESYPSMQSPDRPIKVSTDPHLDVTTTPKKPKSSSWLPWVKKSPKMNHTPGSAELKSKVDIEKPPEAVKLQSHQDQSRPLTTPPFGLPSHQHRPLGWETSSVAEQREARRVAYTLDRKRRQAIKIQAVTRGYLSRRKFPRPTQRAKLQLQLQVAMSEQTRETVIEPSQSLNPKIKSQDKASEQRHRMSTLRNMKPALRSDGLSNAGKPVAEQREARRLAYELDQKRRGSIVIQSALRGYITRKKLGLHQPPSKNPSRSKRQNPPEAIDKKTLQSSLFETCADVRAKDNQKQLLVAPKTPDPVTPKKGLRWLPWAKKRDVNSSPLMDGNPQTSGFTNVQRFDASLYLRTRMYQDENANQGKSLEEIREARRQMYLMDLERREAMKIQSVARGFLVRKKLSPAKKKPITTIPSKVKSAKDKSAKDAKNDSEPPINVCDRFDRSIYLRERLERDEAERRTKSVAEVRLERQQIYLRDLQRREVTRIQAVWRGYQIRKRYPGLAKTFPKKSQKVNQSSAEHTGAVMSAEAQYEDNGDDDNNKQSANWMKRFFFGKPKESPSDRNLPVKDGQKPEYEHFDPYADTDDFFGFSDPKYKERTGFFALEKPKRSSVFVPAVSEDARNWKGRTKQGSNIDFDKVAYLKERKAREEFEKQSGTLARKNAARREAAQKDLERRGALRIQAVARGYIARKKYPLPKTKLSKGSQHAKQQRSKGSVTKVGRQPPPPSGARTTSKRLKKKENGSSAQLGNGSTSSVVKNVQSGAISGESSSQKLEENSVQGSGFSTKAMKKEPSKATSTSTKSQSPGDTIHLQQRGESGKKDWAIASDSEILSEEWSEEIIEEVVLDEEIVHASSTSRRSVVVKKLSKRDATPFKQGSGESSSKDHAVDTNSVTTSPVGVFDQTIKENKPRVHSGSTYSTGVGDSWWLPSIGTEDTRTYREEIQVPNTDLSKYYRRPTPKNSTTTYWEAVRTSYLPSVVDGPAAPVIVPPVVPFSRRSSRSTKQNDLLATSSVHSEESWLPPQTGETAKTTIPHGSTDMVEEPDPEGSWVPAPSKPQANPKRVDFAGTLQKGESFRWAPHLPSPSKRENKPRIDLLIRGDFGEDTLTCDIQESVDIEQGAPKSTPSQTARTSRTKNRRIMTCILFFFVLLVGGSTAAYFFWEDPPWEKWIK